MIRNDASLEDFFSSVKLPNFRIYDTSKAGEEHHKSKSVHLGKVELWQSVSLVWWKYIILTIN